MHTIDDIAKALEANRFDESTEDALQRGVLEVLDLVPGIALIREFRLAQDGHDRIDFLATVDTGDRAPLPEYFCYGIECKTKGSMADVTRQLHRYAQHSRIDGLILVTSRVQLARVPEFLNDKPVRVVATMGGIL